MGMRHAVYGVRFYRGAKAGKIRLDFLSDGRGYGLVLADSRDKLVGSRFDVRVKLPAMDF